MKLKQQMLVMKVHFIFQMLLKKHPFHPHRKTIFTRFFRVDKRKQTTMLTFSQRHRPTVTEGAWEAVTGLWHFKPLSLKLLSE